MRLYQLRIESEVIAQRREIDSLQSDHDHLDDAHQNIRILVENVF